MSAWKEGLQSHVLDTTDYTYSWQIAETICREFQ